MKVAIVRLPDGQARTVKLSQIQNAPPGPGALPVMGRNMTAEAPSVRKVQAEAKPVPGQLPEVKVKQEPSLVQNALAQRPEPVSAQDIGRIGQTDGQSGRQVLQPSNSLVQNERLAADSAPYLTTKLSEAAAAVPGAMFDRLRPEKGLQRLEEKVADGKPPNTIGDNLAAQIVADTVAAKDQLIARLRQQFPIISVDDKFLEPREKAGYPSTNLQLQMPNGGSAEVQIVVPEIQAITDQTHRLYTLGRNFPEGSADRNWYWNQAAGMHRAALEKFQARNTQPSATTFAPGDRVVLRNGEVGKVVGPSRDFRRVVVRTRRGMRTVKPSNIRPQIVPQPPKLMGPMASQTVRNLMKQFVPLAAHQVTDVAARVRFSVEPGTEKLPDVIWVNQPAMHLIWDYVGTEIKPFVGVHLDGPSAEKLSRYFDRRAAELERRGFRLQSGTAAAFATQLRQTSSRHGAAAVVLRTGEEAYDRATAREERGHVIQHRIGGGDIYKHANLSKLWLEPEFKKATATLVKIGYPNNPPSLTLEAAIKLLVGEGRSLGLNEPEKASAIRKYLKSIIEERGRDAIDDLRLVAEPEYHKIFDEAKK